MSLPAGATVVVSSAVAVAHGSRAPDPAPLAAAAAAGAGNGSAALASADAFWGAYWAASAVELPAQPAVQTMFNGNAYALAAFSGFGDDDVPPGLFGPWVSMDNPAWAGDYTMDYNYNAAYFGAFSSGHGAAAAAAFRPVLDYLPAARRKAQGQAARARVGCPATALYYGCHLSPWGLSSTIQSEMPFYMASNGNFASLLFLDRWEYWGDAGFAAEALWPLLDGLNAWWGCYLNCTPTGLPPPRDAVCNDANAFNPDMQHENQRVPNPQISMAFIRRGVDAQVALATALGLPLPSAVAALSARLAPFNTAVVAVPAPASNWSAPLPDTRCHSYGGDAWSWPTPPGNFTLAACEASCAAQAGCALVTLCPPPDAPLPAGAGCTGTSGSPAPYLCFGYGIQWLPNCTAAPAPRSQGFTSAFAQSPGRPVNATVFTAFANATVGESDEFSLYPVWPTGALDVYSSAPSAPADAATAQASSLLYSDFPRGRAVDLFSMAVRAGAGGGNSPQRVLAGLNAYLSGFQTASLLPYAPGGGIENAGVNAAVVDMLLGSSATAPPGAPPPPTLAPFVAFLFPFWPPEQPAAFHGLVARGGHAVAARYDNASGAVVGAVGVTALAAPGGGAGAPVRRFSLRTPWPAAPRDAVSAACGGAQVPVQWAEGYVVMGEPAEVLSFDAPVGVGCAVSVLAAPGRGEGARGMPPEGG